jgi:hypothetical protein
MCAGGAGFTDVVDGDVAEEALVGEPAEDDHLRVADPDRRVPAAGRRVSFQAGFRMAAARRIGRVGGGDYLRGTGGWPPKSEESALAQCIRVGCIISVLLLPLPAM